jgi:hypothetical protein
LVLRIARPGNRGERRMCRGVVDGRFHFGKKGVPPRLFS